MSLSPPPSREDLPVETKNGRLVAVMPRAWIKFFTDIKELLAPVSTGGLLLWTAISKAGSNLTDLTIRNHSDLQNVNSSTYTHLTEINATDLTDGGNTILHKHTHNLEDGLQGGTTDEYYHLSLTHHTDLTDGGNTVLHKHTHNLQDSIQGGAADDYYHLTLVQHTDLTDAGNTILHKHTHNLQDSIQGGAVDDYYHLTLAQHTDLTDSGQTSLHKHDHAAQDNLNSTNYSHLTASQLVATINKMGTCLVTGCTVSINADNTKFDVTSGTLRFVNNYTNPLAPTYSEITYAGSTGNTVTNIATQDATFLSIDSAGILYQSATKLAAGDTRAKALIGSLVHTNNTNISNANSITEVIGFDIPNALADISLAVGPVNSGNSLSGNAVNTLRLNKTAGTFTQTGINWKNSKQSPNIIDAAASTGASFLATWRDGAGGWTTLTKTDIIPGVYDDGTGGATQPNGLVSNNKWTLVKWWYLPNSQIIGIAFGQVVYNSLAEAEAHTSDTTIDNPSLASVPFRGWIAVRGGATDLSLVGDAEFIDAGRFGSTTSSAGSSGLVPTMQHSYDNSTQPQIVTSTTLGAVQFKRGSAADTDVVFEVLNGAGTAVFQVTGQGSTSVSLAVARAVTTLRV